MNIRSTLQNALYFVPLVGTIHHANELYKLNLEYNELANDAPLIKNISGYNSLLAKVQNAEAFEQLDALPPVLKTRVTKYFEDRNRVNQLAAWGSIVQIIICLAAKVLNPAFLVLGKLECIHMLYSSFTLATGSNLYAYDPEKRTSVIYMRDILFGQSAIFGKTVVPMVDPEVAKLRAMKDPLK